VTTTRRLGDWTISATSYESIIISKLKVKRKKRAVESYRVEIHHSEPIHLKIRDSIHSTPPRPKQSSPHLQPIPNPSPTNEEMKNAVSSQRLEMRHSYSNPQLLAPNSTLVLEQTMSFSATIFTVQNYSQTLGFRYSFFFLKVK